MGKSVRFNDEDLVVPDVVLEELGLKNGQAISREQLRRSILLTAMAIRANRALSKVFK